MRRSHKIRLAVFSTVVVGLLLAAIFTAAVFGARRYAVVDEQQEISLAFETVSNLPEPEFSMEELGESGPHLIARVYDSQGRRIASRGDWPPEVAEVADGFAERHGWLVFGGRAKGCRVVLAHSMGDIQRGVAIFSIISAGLWLPLTLLVGGATWYAAHSVFRPLDRLAEAASCIEGIDLSARLPAPDQAEFGALSEVLNHMLDRIEESKLRADRFASDAAHELRTPLAIMQAQIETTLLRPRSPEEYIESHGVLLSEVERVTAVVEALLRASRSSLEPALPIDLEPVVRTAGERFGDARLQMRLTSARASILAEEISIVVDNLLENARRFSPKEGLIRLVLTTDQRRVELSVEDHGPGIPAECSERVFERLYRADDDRNRATGGSGIGLSVCRQIVEARGGTIHAEETPGGGATIKVQLPYAPD